jgi:hypothetical protein
MGGLFAKEPLDKKKRRSFERPMSDEQDPAPYQIFCQTLARSGHQSGIDVSFLVLYGLHPTVT